MSSGTGSGSTGSGGTGSGGWGAIVLGLGGIGSGALYWLARRLGDRVLGIEQFGLGHERGGSQDHSRIIRYSYHTPGYVRLAARAYETWSVVEREADVRLVERLGGLDLFPAGCAIPIEGYRASLEACEIAFELLDRAEIEKRFPAFRLEREDTSIADTVGLYQADAGWVRAALANAAHQRLARAHGAAVLEDAPVERIVPRPGGFQVRTGRGAFQCEKLVITAGAWSNEVLGHFGVELPLTVTQEQVAYFEPEERSRFLPGALPIWIWMDEPSYYGFPYMEGAGLKAAQDVGGAEVTARTRTFDPDPEAQARLEAFCRSLLPGSWATLRSAKTCLYTLTPDRDFVIDRIPGAEGAFVAIGAGHAFKFASVIGRILSELALDGDSPSDRSGFEIHRPILRERDPVRSFLV